MTELIMENNVVPSANGKHKAPHPYEIAKEITQLHNVFATPINSKGVGEEIFFYQNGVYVGGETGELKVRQEACRLMGGNFRADQIDEIMKLVRELARKEYKWINKQGKDLINTKKNMVGWEKGAILDHEPGYNSIFQVNAKYLPDAGSDIVDKFMMEVFPPDCLELAEEIIGY